MGMNAKKELVKLKNFLKEKRKISIEDPSTNPISSLAHHISKKLLGKEIDLQNIELIIDNLSKEQDITVLLITHDPKDAQQIAGHCLVLKDQSVLGPFETSVALDEDGPLKGYL